MSYRPAFEIRATDNAHTYKTGIKEMAIKNGFMATFMSKPFPNRSGSACETPLLYDADRPKGLTSVGEHWVAGLLEHTPAISLLMAPTINCLKRYLPNSFAPSNATWGIDNCTCAFRVILNGKEGTYIENQLWASGCNPYISLAATVAAGMDGIKRKLPLPPSVKETGNAYNLEDIPPGTANVPTDMEEAMRTLQADDVITSAIGKEFIECFLAAKRHEILLQEKNEENREQDLFFEYM
nr:lengsin-like [Lytechinus pictus]